MGYAIGHGLRFGTVYLLSVLLPNRIDRVPKGQRNTAVLPATATATTTITFAILRDGQSVEMLRCDAP